MPRTPPMQMARKLVRLLRAERPDHFYLKKVFQNARVLLEVKPAKAEKRLPALLTDRELVAFYESVWQARNPTHMVLLKLLIFTGLRNAELAHVRIQDVDLDHCQIHVVRGKGRKGPAGTISGILYAKGYPAFDSGSFCTLRVPRRSARNRCNVVV